MSWTPPPVEKIGGGGHRPPWRWHCSVRHSTANNSAPVLEPICVGGGGRGEFCVVGYNTCVILGEAARRGAVVQV